MKRIKNFFVTLRRDAALEAGKITFACIGVGSTLANIGNMGVYLMLPATILVCMTWFAIYIHCE